MVRRNRIVSRTDFKDMISQYLIVEDIIFSRLSARTIYRVTGSAVHCQVPERHQPIAP
jgi:hypothetical protein